MRRAPDGLIDGATLVDYVAASSDDADDAARCDDVHVAEHDDDDELDSDLATSGPLRAAAEAYKRGLEAGEAWALDRDTYRGRRSLHATYKRDGWWHDPGKGRRGPRLVTVVVDKRDALGNPYNIVADAVTDWTSCIVPARRYGKIATAVLEKYIEDANADGNVPHGWRAQTAALVGCTPRHVSSVLDTYSQSILCLVRRSPDDVACAVGELFGDCAQPHRRVEIAFAWVGDVALLDHGDKTLRHANALFRAEDQRAAERGWIRVLALAGNVLSRFSRQTGRDAAPIVEGDGVANENAISNANQVNANRSRK